MSEELDLSADPSVPSWELKLRMGRAHLERAMSVFEAWMMTKPLEPSSAVNAFSGRTVHSVRLTSSVPTAVALEVGEAAQAYRNALDHIAYQIASRATGDAWTTKQQGASAFLIQGSKRDGTGVYQKTKTGLAPRPQVECWPSGAVQVLESMQPWTGEPAHPAETHALFRLSELANGDKHRILPIVATAIVQLGINGPVMSDDTELTFIPMSSLSLLDQPFIESKGPFQLTQGWKFDVTALLGPGSSSSGVDVFELLALAEAVIRQKVVPALSPWM